MKIESSHWTTKMETKSCKCGHCNNIVAVDVYAKYKVGGTVLYMTGDCPFCGKPIIYDKLEDRVYPSARDFSEVKHLPQDVEKLYNEMRDSYSLGAYTCCVIVGRTLLANIAVEQGAEENKNFVYYVDYLVDNFLPKSNSRPWVDKVRILGNESAHHLVIAEKENATISLKFLEAILKNVYEFPNSIEG